MLSPIQQLAIKYLSSGWTAAKTAKVLGLGVDLVHKWKQNHEFAAALERGVVHHQELVEAMLLAGEAKAAETLMEALGAVSSAGSPNWTVRVTAAQSLLDRAGSRGRAVEKQLSVQGHVGSSALKGGNVEEALRKALRDPGVRAWLKDSGAAGDIIQESKGAEDVAIVEEVTDDPPAIPAPLSLPPSTEVA